MLIVPVFTWIPCNREYCREIPSFRRSGDNIITDNRCAAAIIGGEDSEEIVDPDARDALIPSRLTENLRALWSRTELDIELRWAGTFDTNDDGLPLIGPVPGAKGVYAAYAYGGNGITFSYLAAQLIGGLIAGSHSPLLEDFARDRDGPGSQ